MKYAVKWIALMVICVFALSLGACNMVNDGAIATINGEEVTIAEFQYVLNSIGAEMEQEAASEDVEDFWNTEIDGKNAMDVAKDRAFESIVQSILVRQEAKNLGLTLEQADTDAMTEEKNSLFNQLGGREGYEKRLAELGITDNLFSDLMDRRMYEQKLQQHLMETDERFYEPTDEQVQNVIAADYIKAKHILFRTVDDSRMPLSQEEQDVAKAKAEEAYQKIQNGEDYDTLMNNLSEDPGLQQSPDGYIFTKGEMVAAFENAAFALQEGEISQIVESPLGYHIIRREAIDFSVDITDTIKSTVANQILNNNYQVYLEELTGAATITKQDNAIKRMKIKEIPPPAQPQQDTTQTESELQQQLQEQIQEQMQTEPQDGQQLENEQPEAVLPEDGDAQ